MVAWRCSGVEAVGLIGGVITNGCAGTLDLKLDVAIGAAIVNSEATGLEAALPRCCFKKSAATKIPPDMINREKTKLSLII